MRSILTALALFAFAGLATAAPLPDAPPVDAPAVVVPPPPPAPPATVKVCDQTGCRLVPFAAAPLRADFEPFPDAPPAPGPAPSAGFGPAVQARTGPVRGLFGAIRERLQERRAARGGRGCPCR
ncbi:unnamed protein product [Gemmataceae bacterium]|nr:unnamed protein product [Gemmataceae bacterium]VTT96591.1 unnamed protein product [Gemmataceae bacterium]